jgi:spore maturation protein SpmB
MSSASLTNRPLPAFLLAVLREAGEVSLRLFRIMVPILVGVKILQELGAVSYLALPLKPLMQLVGLPGEMGLVWATAMLNNLYSGIVVFLSLPQAQTLSVAQVTVLTTMMLVAHALPVEGRIAQESGNRICFQILLRVGGALLLGVLLHLAYSGAGWLQQDNVIFWQGGGAADSGWVQWGLAQLRNLAAIFLIILGLVLLLRTLERFRVTEFFVRMLEPVLRFLGMGRATAPLTIVGMTMGLTYGGGLIIKESRSGRVPRRDVFASVSMMGLSHSLIEDTMLMRLMGGHFSGILWGRLIFSLAAVYLLVRIVPRLSGKVVHRVLYRTDAGSTADPGPS